MDEAWYDYTFYDYDGGGNMILRIGNLYYFYCLDHCSCYDPLDDLEYELETGIAYKSLRELKNNCSEELQKQLKKFIDI